MDNRERESFRQMLLALGRRLNGDETSLQGDALRPAGATAEGSTINGPGDAGDLSVDQFLQDVSLGLLENRREMLEQVTAALDRLDRGEFGRCTSCGRAIAAERLAALPYTPHCVACARRLQEAGGAAARAAG
jgi:DnaK suppressor protein